MKNLWIWLGSAALLCGVIASISLLYVAMYKSEPLANMDTSSLPSIGSENAPHEILIITDYACPSCRRFHNEVMPSLLRSYVESGRARIRIAVFPVITGSTDLAREVHCAGDAYAGDLRGLLEIAYGSDYSKLTPRARAERLLSAAPGERDAAKLIECARRDDVIKEIERQRYEVMARGINTVPKVIVDRALLEDAWDLRAYERLLGAGNSAPPVQDKGR
jgi:protein-disulfide isomerase